MVSPNPPLTDPPITYVYIDGFNLYYGCLTRSPWKWLDPLKLCQMSYPDYAIEKIYYFTARLTAIKGVRESARSQQRRIRQDIYLSAINTIPSVEIVEGYFRHDQDQKLRVHPLDQPFREERALVWITEEKRSDVNLATQLLVDAHLDLYHTALVISNDSDLTAPVENVKKVFKKRVGILCPVLARNDDPRPHDPRGLPPRPVSSALRGAASFLDQIKSEHLATCQLPDPIASSKGRFTKPPAWYSGQ